MKKTAPLYTEVLEKKGEVDLPESVFNAEWNADLVYQTIVSFRANERRGTASTKDRSEVRGGGKKPWQQKGTGRARHGSSRSPIWRSGGVTFGPSPAKDYSKKINKKMRAKALATILSRRNNEEKIVFFENISMEESKTKRAAEMVKKAFNVLEPTGSRKTLIVTSDTVNSTLKKSFGNIPEVTMIPANRLNADIASRFMYLFFFDSEEVLPSIEKRFI